MLRLFVLIIGAFAFWCGAAWQDHRSLTIVPKGDGLACLRGNEMAFDMAVMR